jgi:hypothetical protein
MPNYKKTEELFLAAGYKPPLPPDSSERYPHGTLVYQKPQAQIDDELFYAKVTNPHTNTFYQIQDLPLEYRQNNNNNNNNKTYPIREVKQIIRIARTDGTEWLKSRGRIVAMDKLGNEVEHSFTDPEVYFEPKLEYGYKPQDPKNPDGPKQRVLLSASTNEQDLDRKKYTLPYNEKNFNDLFKQRPGKSAETVSLSIYEEGSSEKPRQVTLEEIKAPAFDALWEDKITPRFKLDRSFNDNLNGSHIK